jgi:hypothetical protein
LTSTADILLRGKQPVLNTHQRSGEKKGTDSLTRESDKPEIVRRLVVVFDISSSTSILEELKQCDRLAIWRNLLIELKDFLDALGLDLEIYKFMGDGWYCSSRRK